MKILGIETSCDETSAAVIEASSKNQPVTLMSNVIASSLSLHAQTGGIIPEIAAREQVKYIIPVIERALKKACDWTFQSKSSPPIDVIAVTYGPGLIGSLLVGVETAKTLSYVWNKPLIPVNHLYGHIYANFINPEESFQSTSLRATAKQSQKETRLPRRSPPAGELMPRNDNIQFPAIALVVSGGHTDLVLMKDHGKLTWLGGTRDDAAGEAFDKIGRLLGLPYPAGPVISKFAEQGNPKAFNFPRPMIGSNDFDFSFSGLKTAVLNLLKKDAKLSIVILGSSAKQDDSRISSVNSTIGDSGQAPPQRDPDPDIVEDARYHRHVIGARMTMEMTKNKNQLLAGLCASVQQTIIDVLLHKTFKAVEKYHVQSLLLGGGVAANHQLRNQFSVQSSKSDVKFFVPIKNLCTDNAAMIASAAFFNAKQVSHWSKLTANPELYFASTTPQAT